MKTISNQNFSGKKVLVRVDFNVPTDEQGKITDPTRILAAKPTIDHILSSGGSVILMTHLGRPKGKKDAAYSLQPLLSQISSLLEKEIKFSPETIGSSAEKMAAELQAGEVLLLENVRFYEGEEKGDADFASELAKLGDVYVNDAFGTAHRKHASTAVIAEHFPNTKFFGLLMEKELKAIDNVLHQAEKPVTAILGGAKVSSKITIIKNILPVIDHLIVGGGMAFTFVRANGGQVGASMVEEDKLELAVELLELAKAHQVKVHLPVDVIAAKAFSNEGETKTMDIYHMEPEWMGLDVGPDTRALFHDVVMNSRTILWNGPLGVFEMSNFSKGTEALGESIAEATRLGAFSLVGGGDSVAFVKQFGYDQKVSYVSTGGGAMLESLEGIELPGISAINN